MHWKKLGLLLAPKPEIFWMSHYAGPSFARQAGGKILLYVTGRDEKNISRIGTVEIEIDGERSKIKSISAAPVFDVGEIGLFDESGVSYPWLVEQAGKIFMYYVGWVAGGKTRFANFTGLAISDDEGRSFKRVGKTPILDRTREEPYGSGSCCVFIEAGTWKMYYTAFGPWESHASKPKPHYNIKFASSANGIDWVRDQKIIVDCANPGEHVIGKPMLVKDPEAYRLWYSFRGDAYRIGYAESSDGLTFKRRDGSVGIAPSPAGWDSESVEYAFVFDHGGRRYMIYNGNDFGKTGLGLAILETGNK